MRGLVLEYYAVMRAVLVEKPHLRPCRTRCRHCGIFFITHPRNKGRKDLGCPFGCRQSHHQRGSTARSVEYYRTEDGKVKKRKQNGKRGKGGRKADQAHEPAATASPAEGAGSGFDPEIVEHLRMVTGQIEGRAVSREATEAMLARVMRQHSIDYRKWIGDILRSREKKEEKGPP